MAALTSRINKVDIPPLTPEQQQLVTQWAPLAGFVVGKVASKWSNYRLDYDDLVSDANLALCRAAATWRPDGGAKFSTYAYRGIRMFLTSSTRNMAEAYRRKEKIIRRELAKAIDEHEPNNHKQQSLCPHHNLVATEKRQRIEAIVDNHFAGNEKDILKMHLAGKRPSEMRGKVYRDRFKMQLKYGSIKMKKCEGIRKLHQIFTEQKGL
jgi:RNA polymerase sigma factor (sigma-70 family)